MMEAGQGEVRLRTIPDASHGEKERDLEVGGKCAFGEEDRGGEVGRNGRGEGRARWEDIRACMRQAGRSYMALIAMARTKRGDRLGCGGGWGCDCYLHS